MTTTRPSLSQDRTEKVSSSLLNWLFPDHRKIAMGSLFSVNLIYLIYWLFRFIPSGSFGASQITGTIAICAIMLLFQWFLYRLLAVVGGSETSRSLAFLTIPSLVIAILSAFLGGLIQENITPNADLATDLDLLFIQYLVLAGWGALYLALVQSATMKEAIVQSRKLERLTRESELRALRFQLNPHFIFNALNSVSSLVVDKENEKAERLVENLADYMRSVLDDDGENIVTVEEEVSQQLRYLEIEQVRFPERLKIETQIDETAKQWKIPALIIQPLVENAIKHGVAKSADTVRIILSAQMDAGRLKISVANDGHMESRTPNMPDGGTGLTNIQERLATVYGPSAALVTANRSDGMAVASIIVPDESYMFGNY